MEAEHYLKKELYQRLKDDSQLFDWIEQGSLDGLWYWDLKNSENEWLSPQFMKTFGYEVGEIPYTSQWWQDNIFEEDLPRVLENFDKHCADPNHPFDQIVRYRHKSGDTVWIRCRGLVMFDEQGQPERMIGAHTDVSSLMKAKIELEKTSEKLAHSNEELNSFAYAASHDLKAPLRSIKQLASWIKEDVPNPSEETAENFALLEDRVSRMEHLLDSLLEYSRLEHGAKNEPEPVNTLDITKALFSFLSPPKGFNLVIDGDMPTFNAVKTPFEQVLRNLIGNAIKHRSSDSGSVVIWCKAEPTHFRFFVGDDGVAIPSEFQDKIFDMFETLKPKDQVEGSGMGLAMAKKIIQQHDGVIGVILNKPSENEALLPNGCTKAFYFTWPR